ncbi:MAG: hypothetical protein JXB49_33440 [Bacteroidales bacterium]|nr:hypothetical protein [Bacteroidales bacterium]
MNYLLFANSQTGSPIISEIGKVAAPKVVITRLKSIDSWGNIIHRFLKNNLTVEDKLRFFYKIRFYDYHSLNVKRLKRIIENNNIEIGFITTFSYIIPQKFIELFPNGIYNFHPSLLPKHGGPNALFWVVFSNDEYTGTTCHRVTEVLDHGQILLQKKYPVNKMDARELFNCYVKDIAGMIQDIMSNYRQLFSNSRDMEVTEYDPPQIPYIDFSESNNNRDLVLRYKRAIRPLV